MSNTEQLVSGKMTHGGLLASAKHDRQDKSEESGPAIVKVLSDIPSRLDNLPSLKKLSVPDIEKMMSGVPGVRMTKGPLRDPRDPLYVPGQQLNVTIRQNNYNVSSDGVAYGEICKMNSGKFHLTRVIQGINYANRFRCCTGSLEGYLNRLVRAKTIDRTITLRSADINEAAIRMAKEYLYDPVSIPSLVGKNPEEIMIEGWTTLVGRSDPGLPWTSRDPSTVKEKYPDALNISKEIFEAASAGDKAWAAYRADHREYFTAKLKLKNDRYLFEDVANHTKTRGITVFCLGVRLIYSILQQAFLRGVVCGTGSGDLVKPLPVRDTPSIVGHKWNNGGAQRLLDLFRLRVSDISIEHTGGIVDIERRWVSYCNFGDDCSLLMKTVDGKVYYIYTDISHADLSYTVPLATAVAAVQQNVFQAGVQRLDNTWTSMLHENARMISRPDILVESTLMYTVDGHLASGLPGTTVFGLLGFGEAYSRACSLMREEFRQPTNIDEVRMLVVEFAKLVGQRGFKLKVSEPVHLDDSAEILKLNVLGKDLIKVQGGVRREFVPVTDSDRIMLSFLRPRRRYTLREEPRARMERAVALFAAGGFAYSEIRALLYNTFNSQQASAADQMLEEDYDEAEIFIESDITVDMSPLMEDGKFRRWPGRTRVENLYLSNDNKHPDTGRAKTFVPTVADNLVIDLSKELRLTTLAAPQDFAVEAPTIEGLAVPKIDLSSVLNVSAPGSAPLVTLVTATIPSDVVIHTSPLTMSSDSWADASNYPSVDVGFTVVSYAPGTTPSTQMLIPENKLLREEKDRVLETRRLERDARKMRQRMKSSTGTRSFKGRGIESEMGAGSDEENIDNDDTIHSSPVASDYEDYGSSDDESIQRRYEEDRARVHARD